MSHIPPETIAQIAALKLPPKTQMAILQIIAAFVQANGAKKGTAMPEDWAPSDSDIEYGIAHGLTHREIDAYAEEMRVWAGANRNRPVARKADWGLTFKGWLLREAKKRKGSNRGGALDVVMELEEQARPLNGANGHGKHKRNGAPSSGGLLAFDFSAGHTGGPERD